MKKKMLHLILVCGLMCHVSIRLHAQDRISNSTLDGTGDQEILANCENSIAVLSGLAQKAVPDELIIAIARLGQAETRPLLNHRRLHNVRVYLTEYITVEGGRRKPETIILAEGERVKGYGRIELYVSGKLFYVFKMRRNADLHVGDCGSEPPAKPCPPEERKFYPCRNKYKKRV